MTISGEIRLAKNLDHRLFGHAAATAVIGVLDEITVASGGDLFDRGIESGGQVANLGLLGLRVFRGRISVCGCARVNGEGETVRSGPVQPQ